MLFKLIIAGALGLFLLSLGSRNVFYNSGGQNASEWKERKSLKARARQAQAEGKRNIVLPGPIVTYAGRNIDLETALKTYSVVIAQPVANKSYVVNSHSIHTWYKFRVLQTLSARQALFCETCAPLPEIPKEAEPLRANEFVIITSGGTVNVDGVDITLTNKALPPFLTGQQYLLFVSFTPSKVTALGGGPSGVFMIKDDGELQPVDNSARLPAEFNRRFTRKLSKFESHIKS